MIRKQINSALSLISTGSGFLLLSPVHAQAAARFKAALDTELSTVIAEQAQVTDQVPASRKKSLRGSNETLLKFVTGNEQGNV